MIEQLDILQTKAEEFEKEKANADVLAIAIVNVGFSLLYFCDSHRAIWEPKSVELDRFKSTDGSKYNNNYPLTYLGQPIGLAEYASRLAAAGNSTHVMCLLDSTNNFDIINGITPHHIDKNEPFHELILMRRTGQKRLTFT